MFGPCLDGGEPVGDDGVKEVNCVLQHVSRTREPVILRPVRGTFRMGVLVDAHGSGFRRVRGRVNYNETLNSRSVRLRGPYWMWLGLGAMDPFGDRLFWLGENNKTAN